MAERLTTSEAIALVGTILSGFPTKDKLDKGYIGAIVKLLLHYPKSVAVKCADPFNGVVRGIKYPPSPSDIISWCEKEIAPLHQEAERERRVEQQLDAREQWDENTVPDSLKAKGKAWLDRTDPAAKEISGQLSKQGLADQARTNLIREYGEAAFNAVPDVSAGYFKKLSVET